MISEHNPVSDCTFGPEHRLHSNRDYGRVFHRQQKAAGKHTVVLLTPRPRQSGTGAPQPGRLGVMIGAKAVKTAVRRHQLKRWLRELFRTQLKELLVGHDCVVLFRSNPPTDCRAKLLTEVAALATKALTTSAQPAQRGGRRR